MNTVPSSLLIRVAVVLLAVALAGCATYYQPRYGDDGVYYEERYAPARTYGVYAANPVYYPYWSLDYFYFSRHYHPYSVFVGYHDPFYYPYPGWYYGYRPGPRVSIAFSHGFYYPWFGYGVHYHHFHPWRFATVHHHHHFHKHPVRRQDARLRELQRREVAAARTRPTLTGVARAQQLDDRRIEHRRAGAPRGTLTRSSRQQGQSGSPSTDAATPSQRSRDQSRATSDRPTLRDAARRSGSQSEQRSRQRSDDRPVSRSRGIDMSSFQSSGARSGSGGNRPAVRSTEDFSQARATRARPDSGQRPAARSPRQQDAGALQGRIQRAGPPRARQATGRQSGLSAAGPRSRESAPSRAAPPRPASRAPSPPSRSAAPRSPESSPSSPAPRSASPPSRSTRHSGAPSREASRSRGSTRSGSRPSRRDGGGRDRRPD